MDFSETLEWVDGLQPKQYGQGFPDSLKGISQSAKEDVGFGECPCQHWTRDRATTLREEEIGRGPSQAQALKEKVTQAKKAADELSEQILKGFT